MPAYIHCSRHIIYHSWIKWMKTGNAQFYCKLFYQNISAHIILVLRPITDIFFQVIRDGNRKSNVQCLWSHCNLFLWCEGLHVVQGSGVCDSQCAAALSADRNKILSTFIPELCQDDARACRDFFCFSFRVFLTSLSICSNFSCKASDVSRSISICREERTTQSSLHELS